MSDLDEPTLVTELLDSGVLLVTLNRPHRLNALTFEMFDELERICGRAEHDTDVRVMVVTGRGSGFCSGLDLDLVATLPGMEAPDMLAGQQRWARGITALCRLPKPVIAAVNGAAAGAGFGLALAADIRIAAASARFNAPFVRIGLSGGDVGISWLLPRVVGLGHAAEILLTGRMIDADDALRRGLVSGVVADSELLGTATALAREIAAHSPFGVRLTKQVLHANAGASSLETALELENRTQVLATRTRDVADAMAARRTGRRSSAPVAAEPDRRQKGTG